MRHTILFPVLFVLFIFTITAGIDKAACSSRWGGSGLGSSWGPIQGCLVKLPDGRLVPEDAVREIIPALKMINEIKVTP